jgi:hypothetical protein
VTVNGNVLGDLWSWIVGVVERIGDVSVYWLALALALKTAESALIGLSWRNILRVAYPHNRLSFKTAWAASQGGTAINAVAPAQAGTVAMIGIFRTSIPGASVAGVAAAAAAQALFFTAVSVLMLIGVAVLLPRVISKARPRTRPGASSRRIPSWFQPSLSQRSWCSSFFGRGWSRGSASNGARGSGVLPSSATGVAT